MIFCDSIITSAAHLSSTTAVMQLLDNDTSHVPLYLTLGMLLHRMTHICFHRNRGEISAWFMWLDLMIRPFLDNGAVQFRGHRRALTPCWIMLCHHMLQQLEWRRLTFLDLPLCLSHRLTFPLLSVHVCVQMVWFQQPWGSNLAAWVLSFTSHCQTSPPLPALFVPATPPPAPTPLPRRSPASFFSSHPSSLHCSNHDVLVSTLSKWVMRCNYGVNSGMNVDGCNCTFVWCTANEMV